MSIASDSPVKSVYRELLKLTREGHHTWCANFANFTRSIENIASIDTDIGFIKRALKLATVRRYEDK